VNLHIWPQPHAQNPSAGSSTSTSAFDAKSCSVGTGRSASQDLQACSLRVSSVLGAARPKTYKHARYACHIDPLLSAPPREFIFLFRMSHPEYLRLALWTRCRPSSLFQATTSRSKVPASSIHLQIRPWARGKRDSASI